MNSRIDSEEIHSAFVVFLSNFSIVISLYFFFFISKYRKISAHEFERGGLLKPILNTIDGTPTFLSVGSQHDFNASLNNQHHTGYTANSTGGHHHHHHRPQRLSRIELKALDEKELIFELVRYCIVCVCSSNIIEYLLL